jgi:hypothetical protein
MTSLRGSLEGWINRGQLPKLSDPKAARKREDMPTFLRKICSWGVVICLAWVLFLELWGSPVFAQDERNPVSVKTIQPQSKPKQHEATQHAKKKNVIRFDNLTVMGEAKSPQVYYLLNRKQIELKHQPAKYDLLPGISESLEGKPF